jgi:hypothetical protein
MSHRMKKKYNIKGGSKISLHLIALLINFVIQSALQTINIKNEK